MSRTRKYTDMGWPEYGALWEYELLSEPLLSSELSRLAFAAQHSETHTITFQPSPNPDDKNQDRYTIHDWPLTGGTWHLRALFDGHAGHDTVDYAVQTLPSLVHAALESLVAQAPNPSPAAISDLLTTAISSLDEQLTRDLLQLFPDPSALSRLTDKEVQDIINDHDSGGANAGIVSRCMRGTTVLLSLVDPQQQNLWVASLGDCQAALGRQCANGGWETTLLSSFHNGKNSAEQERIKAEHPTETECVLDDRVLGAIAVTRAVGDHLFKLPTIYTERVFLNAKSGFQISKRVKDFIGRNRTPPYISSHADVRHTEIASGEGYLILCTDGLLDLCEGNGASLDQIADEWVQLVAKRSHSGDASHAGSNLALCILRDALGGDDQDKVSRQMTVEMTGRWMDDTTILVQQLGSLQPTTYPVYSRTPTQYNDNLVS